MAAQHDAPPGVSCFGACAPCGSRGNYIMFPSATKGTEFNNDKFSPCSLRNITSVLKPMFEGRSNRENCFQVFAGPICGNDIVEGNEECDCGAYLADCEEKCCYPRHNTVGAPGCTLRKGEDCSPSAGPCCTTDCKLLDSSVLCKQDTMCRNLSYCDGINATCPLGPPKPDLTPCNEGTQVCMKGECSSSICMKYGLKECTLTGSRYSVDELCLIACQESATPAAFGVPGFGYAVADDPGFPLPGRPHAHQQPEQEAGTQAQGHSEAAVAALEAMKH